MAEQGVEQIVDMQEEENVAKLPEQGVEQVLELEEQEVAEILQELANHGLEVEEEDVGKFPALPVIENSPEGDVYVVKKDDNQYVYNTLINVSKREKSIKTWRNKTSHESLGEKFLDDVTGQHIVDLWNNEPVADEIILYFYDNIETLFYSEKSESFNLLFPLIL